MKNEIYNSLHYLVAVVLIAVYGAVVCPFIAGLSFLQVIIPLAFCFGAGYALRTVLRSQLLGAQNDANLPERVLQIEFASIMATGVLYIAYNALVFAFPVGSALKVMLGVFTIACFVATEVTLRHELQIAQYCKKEKIQVKHSDSRRSFTVLIMLIASFPVVLLTILQILAFDNDLAYLEKIDSISEIAKARQGILLEAFFIASIVLGYLLTVALAATRLLAFHLDNQRSALKRVSEGYLRERVAVVSNDEFSSIARYTNSMLCELEEHNKTLQRTQDATIMSLATLAETRDNETGAHIMRTQRYVQALAEYLAGNPDFEKELTPQFIKLIYKAAPLHDIGKVGVPDSVLHKPGKLTDSEYDTMKTHTILGLRALEVVESELGKVPFISCAKDLVATHHERWDGNGYPSGLKADDIPLCGRLMAIADVYDALISERVYKRAFSHQEARDIIVEGRGSQFDPAIVDAFIACEAEFQAIADQFDEKGFTIAQAA